MNAQAEVRTSRRGGRDARRSLRTSKREDMLPSLRHGLPYTEPLDGEQIARIHEASMAILEEVGVDFRDPTALEDRPVEGTAPVAG